MASFTARDGTTIKDGDKGTFTLLYDGGEHPDRARYGEVEVTGTVRRFDQVERVYDEEHIAIGTTSEEHWEIVTGDPQHPAVGFRPENVQTRSS